MNRAEKRRQQKLARKAQKQAGQNAGATQGAAPTTAPTLSQSLDLAVQLHNAGDLQNAEKIYRDLLRADPDHPQALHLLGVIANQIGNYAAAEELISKAVAIKPDFAEAFSNLGATLKALGRPDEAIERYRAAIDIQPGLAGAHYNLANTLQETGRLDEAIAHFRKAIDSQPGHVQAHNNLGLALQGNGEIEEAVLHFKQAISLNPGSAESHNNLGLALRRRGEAEAAEGHFKQAVALDPGAAKIHSNLGNAVKDQGRLKDTADHFFQALEIAPDNAELHADIATIYWQLGRTEDALASFRKAVALKPDYADARSNLLFLLHYGDLGDEEIYNEHRLWDRHHAGDEAAPIPIAQKDRDPDKRLRIGFVSGDLRKHSVTYFLKPLFGAYDRKKLLFHCYSNAPASSEDQVSARLREMLDGWTCIDGKDDKTVAGMIRADGIDILVDLSGHTKGHRLPLFAKRAAPIQVTWLGYPNTTGLTAMDYRFTDAVADPPGETGTYSAETLVRLPHGFHCYQPYEEAPDVADPPMAENGYVTFGSFNALSKITPGVVTAWAQILKAVPGSRLLIKNRSFTCPGARQRYESMFAAEAVEPDRLSLFGRHQATEEHLAHYGEIDISLDSFPFNGVTTTCEALWMGVPVIAVRGKRQMARIGASLLTRVGLESLVAEDVDDYVARAVALAEDRDRLAELRAGMRTRMHGSPLCNGTLFAEAMEAAFREMWTERCEGAP